MGLSSDHYLKFFVIVNLRKQILKTIMRNISMYYYKVFIMLTPLTKTMEVWVPRQKEKQSTGYNLYSRLC